MAGRRLFRWLSRLIDAPLRGEWLREWEAELAHARVTGRSDRGVYVAAAEDAVRQLPDRVAWMGGVQDVRFALRSLRANPVFALAAAGTLALGIGANTSTYSVVHAVLVRPLPMPEPDRVVAVLRERANGGLRQTSAANYLDWRDRNRSFTGLAAAHVWSTNLTGQGRPRRIDRTRVTFDFFDVLRVAPVHGRAFHEDDGVYGASPVAVLSHTLWQDAFGGDPEVIGRTAELDGVPHVIVGVLPAGLRVPPLDADVFVPLQFDPEWLSARGRNNLHTVGRLRDGVSLQAARADMSGIARDLAAEYPLSNEGWGIEVRPLRSAAVGDAPAALWTLLGAVGLVLLLACANVANLLIARGEARGRELAVRVALGASRGRLVTQLLAEAVVLALAGGALAVLVAYATLPAIRGLVPPRLAAAGDVTLSAPVLVFTLAASLVTGVLAGLLPALRLGVGGRGPGNELAGRLRERGGQSRVRRGLAAAQFAIATVLLVGAGLMVRSLGALAAVDVGVRTPGLATFEVTFPEATYPEPERVAGAVRGVLVELAANPRIERAAAVSHLPLTGDRLSSSVELEGVPVKGGNDGPSAAIRVVTPGYFETLGITVLEGRVFEERDHSGAEPVAVINDIAARRFWADGGAVGRWITWSEDSAGEPVRRRVVGIVAGTRHAGPAAELAPEVYEPYGQTTAVWGWFGGSMSFVVRTRDGRVLDLTEAQDAVAPIDGDLPVTRLAAMDDVFASSVAAPRFNSVLTATFGAIAIVLAVIGMYGVLATSVRQRTRELGIRMALGAGQSRVHGDVLRDGLRTAAAGAAVGMIAALIASRFARALLWGVEPTDIRSYAGAVGVLLVATLVASYLPARRASRVDPVIALRAE